MEERQTITFIPLENGNVSFEIPYNRSYLFEKSTTLQDGFLALKGCEKEYNKYEIPFQCVRVISKILKGIDVDVDTHLLSEEYGKPDFVDLGQSFLRDEQYAYIQRVMKFFNGLLTLPTGFGKNTMMVYLIQASLHRVGNILLMAPTYSIVDEIISRCEKYGVSVSKDYDTSARIWAINPVGLMSSKRLEDGDIVAWLQDVTTLIMDECQEINNSQETLMNNYLPNCVYRYGVSATSDKHKGYDLTDFTNLSHIKEDTFKILKYFGPAIVYKPPQRKIRVVDTPIAFGKYRNLWSYDKCVAHICHSKLFPRYVSMCIQDNNRFGRSTILLPITNKSHVEYLLEDPVMSQYHIIMWTASGIKHNNGIPEERKAGLERVKELVNHHEVDLVICTSVAFKGVDITELKSVLFVTSSSYGMVTQILGRIFRYSGLDYPNVYLPRDTSDNPLYNASYWKRRAMILKNDHILETRLISGSGLWES